MNLTVTAAMESLKIKDPSQVRLDEIQAQEAYDAQFTALCNDVKGTVGVLEDMCGCIDYLQDNGYKQEWFNIVNEGNRFIALTNLEMPKFFGTDETKKEACLESLWTTIKPWLQKAWDFLKKVFELVMVAVRKINSYWGNHDAHGAIGTIVKKVGEQITERVEKNSDLRDQTLTVPNVRKLATFVQHTMDSLIAINNKSKSSSNDMFYEMACKTGSTGDAQTDIMYTVAGMLMDAGIQVDMPEANGFALANGRIEFFDYHKLEPITFVVSDVNALGDFQDACSLMDSTLKATDSVFGQVLSMLGKNKKAFEDAYHGAEKSNRVEDVQEFLMNSKRATALLKLVQTWSVFAANIRMYYISQVKVCIINKCKEFGIPTTIK